MDGILITIIVITAFLVYRIISSSRKQEGYKRWKATSSGKEEKTTKVKWEHGAWLRHALGGTVPRAQYVQKFDESAVVWCANLLGVETARLKEILRDVSEHYREFWMRKRKGGYRMISAPDKELQSIQTTINSRILSSVTMIHPAAVGFRSGHSVVDNASPHLGKRYVLKMDIHDFFFSIRSRRVKKTFENGARLAASHIGQTLVITVVNLFPVLWFLISPQTFSAIFWIWVFVGGGVQAFVNSLFLVKIFDRLAEA